MFLQTATTQLSVRAPTQQAPLDQLMWLTASPTADVAD